MHIPSACISRHSQTACMRDLGMFKLCMLGQEWRGVINGLRVQLVILDRQSQLQSCLAPALLLAAVVVLCHLLCSKHSAADEG